MATALEVDNGDDSTESSNLNMWSNTTHQYLYNLSESTCTKKLIAIFVIIIQFYVYGVVSYLSYQQERENEANKKIINVKLDLDNEGLQYEYGKQQSCGTNGLDASMDDLLCYDREVGSLNPNAVFIWGGLIIVYVLPDLVKAIKSFKRNFMVSIVLILEVIAAIVASVFVVLSQSEVTDLGVLYSAVAIIFIHDIDEKVYEIVQACVN